MGYYASATYILIDSHTLTFVTDSVNRTHVVYRTKRNILTAIPLLE